MPRRILVSGAAGFIGSHLTDRLVDLGLETVGFDNLSVGRLTNLAHVTENPHFQFVKGDLMDPEAVRGVVGECDFIYHLAADPEVRTGAENPKKHIDQNLLATYNLLEALRERGTPTRMVFASTSTVYGEPSIIPTPESYGPLLPISTYGATKLACEALASAYTELLGLRVLILRLANVVGPRSRHGVIYDFINKLRANDRELEILGDGKQTKSYLHIDDCIDAHILALDDKLWSNRTDVYNVGSDDRIDVLSIARIVAETLNLNDVKFKLSKRTGERAWPGDVATMQLDSSKIRNRGWKSKLNSEGTIRKTGKQLKEELQNLQ